MDLIVSIPHSGTRFLMERLGVGHYVHTTKPWDALLRSTERRTLIAPLRAPLEVWRSYIKRWVDPHMMPDDVGWVRSWWAMHALTMEREIKFIPLDRWSADHNDINDWTPVGHVEAEGWVDKWAERFGDTPDMGHIYELPFVRRFYT